jgi:NarL family two-component system response regulator YdfI
VADRPADRLDDAGQATRSTTGKGGRPALTARELQVLEAVTRGQRTRQIAARLDIAERTVKAHLASIYGKLDVDSRAGAVAQAIRRGLVPDE